MHLQNSGLPIKDKAGVGHRLRPGFDLPDLTFTHDPPDPQAVLRRAIRLRQVVAFDYATPGQTPGPRRLRPLAIWDMPDGFVVSGWCEGRADFRTFRADRITQLATTGARFTPDAQTDLAAFLSRESCD